MLFLLGVGISWLLATPPDSSINFVGNWQNERGSTMVITEMTDGQLTGYYYTGVGQPSPDESFRLTGFAMGDQIVFAVDFSQYGSMTAWAGQHITLSGQEQIRTLWHLSDQIPDEDEPAQLWRGIISGASTFVRME